MKKTFRAYINLSLSEYDELWGNAYFSFDANVLLDLYRYQPASTESFLSLLEALKTKNPLWLSYQAGKEFLSNRAKVIKSQRLDYARAVAHLEKLGSAFKSDFPRHAFLPTSEYGDRLTKTATEIIAEIKEFERNHLDVTDTNRDKTLARVLAIFDGAIGARPTDEALKKNIEECKRRSSDGKSPTTLQSKDTQKDSVERQFGDTLIWLELLEHARAIKRPLIFVTAEKKDDWWYRVNSEIVGPRQDMIEEMIHTVNQHYHAYSPVEFMERGSKYIGAGVASRSIIDDVQSFAKTKENTIARIIAIEVRRVRTIGKDYLHDLTSSVARRRFRMRIEKCVRQLSEYSSNIRVKESLNLLEYALDMLDCTPEWDKRKPKETYENECEASMASIFTAIENILALVR